MGLKQSQLQNLIIFIGDVIGITIGYFLMTHLRFQDDTYWIHDSDVYYRWVIAVFLLTLLYLLFNPNAGFFRRKFLTEAYANLKNNVMLGAGMATAAYLISDAENYSRLIYGTTILFTFLWMQVTHCLYRWYILHDREHASITRKMLIVTTSDRVYDVVRNVIKEKKWDIWVTGVIVIDKNMVGRQIQGIPVVANKENMFPYAIRNVVDDVFIHVPYRSEWNMEEMVEEFEAMGITVNLNIHLFELQMDTEKHIDRIGKYYTVSFYGKTTPLHMLFLKRMIDIIGGIVGLCITGLATIVLAPIIKLESPGPLFFSQERVGRNGRIFKIYKFRSMYADAEERKKELLEKNEMDGLMFKMKDDPRITKVGKFIRKTSIDELPQFWNVLKGDMSLVGTRPPTVDEFEHYEGYHKRRLSMTPGLTGVWQVSGRSDITDFEEVVRMDVDYIQNWSLKRDFIIILQTVAVVLGSSGAR